MFCPECGKTDCELIEGICKDCFLKNFKLITIPEKIEVTICSHCNAKLNEGKWEEYNIPEEEIIYRALERAIEINPLIENEEIDLEIIQMKGSIAETEIGIVAIVLGKEIQQHYKQNVRLKKTVCPNCSKMNSGYYEAVIQLRTDEKELSSDEIIKVDSLIKNFLESSFEKNKLAYLVQKDTIKEGIDYYIGSYKEGRKIANNIQSKFGGVIKESPRLVSQDKSTGKGLYRIWISVRLPKFKKKDFISYSSKIAQILSIDNKKIIAIDLETNSKFSISWKEYDDIESLKKYDDIEIAEIISKSPNKIQILDPEDYEVIDIYEKNKSDNLEIGDKIKIIKLNNKIYPLFNQY